MIISCFVHNSIINSDQNADLSSDDNHLLLRIPKHSEDAIILSLRRQESAKSPRPARQTKQLEEDLEEIPLRRQESSLRS